MSDTLSEILKEMREVNPPTPEELEKQRQWEEALKRYDEACLEAAKVFVYAHLVNLGRPGTRHSIEFYFGEHMREALRQMEKEGIVEQDREGTTFFYRLRKKK